MLHSQSSHQQFYMHTAAAAAAATTTRVQVKVYTVQK